MDELDIKFFVALRKALTAVAILSIALLLYELIKTQPRAAWCCWFGASSAVLLSMSEVLRDRSLWLPERECDFNL